MSKNLQEAVLSSRNARDRLPIGLHWRGVDVDIHLGFRKSAKGGKWLARCYVGDGKYWQKVIGVADDVVHEGAMDYATAMSAAKAAVVEERQQRTRKLQGQPVTVASCVQEYILMRNKRDSKRAGTEKRSDADYKLSAYVLADEKLAEIEIQDLTEADLGRWRDGLPKRLAATTINRIVNDFRAALISGAALRPAAERSLLNEVLKQGFRPLDTVVDDFSEVRENQILNDDQVRRIIDVARKYDSEEGDFFRLVVILAATGARFSQVARLTVGDLQPENNRIMMPSSWKGKNKTLSLTPLPLGEDVISLLINVHDGRKSGDALLERWTHRQISGTKWVREKRGPWTTPSQMTQKWKAVMSEIELSGFVPYALRHSSIVRSIRMGIPLRLIAATHDTSAGIIEKTYSRFIADGLSEIAARAVVPLVGINEAMTIIPDVQPNERS